MRFMLLKWIPFVSQKVEFSNAEHLFKRFLNVCWRIKKKHMQILNMKRVYFNIIIVFVSIVLNRFRSDIRRQHLHRWTILFFFSYLLRWKEMHTCTHTHSSFEHRTLDNKPMNKLFPRAWCMPILFFNMKKKIFSLFSCIYIYIYDINTKQLGTWLQATLGFFRLLLLLNCFFLLYVIIICIYAMLFCEARELCQYKLPGACI